MKSMHQRSVPKFYVLPLLFLASLLVTFVLSHATSAASSTIYLSPTGGTVQKGRSITLSLRVNPVTTIDGVEGTVHFSSSHLRLTSVSTSDSAFPIKLTQSQTGSSITLSRGNIAGNVSGDSLVATLTFTALDTSEKQTISLSNTHATAKGSYVPITSKNASISITAASSSITIWVFVGILIVLLLIVIGIILTTYTLRKKRVDR